jgi:hypothetical protein
MDANEISRWAAFLAIDGMTGRARDDAVDALVDAAGGRADRLHDSWIRSLARIGRGEGTRAEADLLKASLERVRHAEAA